MTMKRRSLFAGAIAYVALVLAAGAAPAQPAANDVVVESYLIPSGDSGVSLYIRNKRLRSADLNDARNIVLFTHGSPEPAENSLDLRLSGQSWMDHLARRGFDVYLVDLRGHGRSTRPPEMSQPANENKPLLSSAKAAQDFSAAVDHVLQRRRAGKLNLMAWSRGAITIGVYAESNPDKVEKLVMIGPSYAPATAASGGTAPANAPAPAYVSFDRRTAMERWLSGVPEAKRRNFVPDAWIDAWWMASMEGDWEGALQDTPVYRGPNGWYQFASEYQEAGKPFFYDPARLTTPVLIVAGEWDRVNPPSGAQAIFNALINAREKRFVQIGEGTHYMHREKVGAQVIGDVANFLSAQRD